MNRYCACGCGTPITGTPRKLYFDRTHKTRQYHRDHPRDQSKAGKAILESP